MRTSRILGSAVVLGVVTVVTLYLLLHVLRPDYNPLQRFLSEYAVGRFGVLMTAAFFLQALIPWLSWLVCFGTFATRDRF